MAAALPHVDVLVEIPELDGIPIRPGTSYSITGLEQARPKLRLGRLEYEGVYSLAIGTIAAFARPSSGAIAAGGELVSLVSCTRKRLVFTRVAGGHDDLQAITDTVLAKRGRPKALSSGRAPRGRHKAAAMKKKGLMESAEKVAKARPTVKDKKQGKRKRVEEEEEEEEEEESELDEAAFVRKRPSKRKR